MDRRRLQLAVSDRKRAAEPHAAHEGEVLEHERRRLQSRVAATQAAEARAFRQFLVGLQRGADHLAVEVDDRVEHDRESAAGIAAEAGRRTDRREPRRGDRRWRERVLDVAAGQHRRGAKERAHGALRAAAEVAAEHRVTGERDNEQLRARDLRRDEPGVGCRRTQVLRAGEDQRRDVWKRPRGGRRRRGVRPARAVSQQAGLERRRCVEGSEARGRLGVQRRERFLEPHGRRGAALPREQRLLAAGRDEQGFVDRLGAFHARFFVAPARDGRDEPLREQMQAQQRVGVAVQGRLHRGGQQRAQRGVEVAGLEDREQAGLGQRGGVPMPGSVIHRAAERALAQAGRQARHVARRVGRDPRAGALRAEL